MAPHSPPERQVERALEIDRGSRSERIEELLVLSFLPAAFLE
jgi:hypothetical protein